LNTLLLLVEVLAAPVFVVAEVVREAIGPLFSASRRVEDHRQNLP
jgi:hypothetical protein